MEWTAETDAMILALDAAGLTRRAIAERLGVTRNAICGKLHRLKPRRETIVDEPTEPLPGPTLGKWWETTLADKPEAVDETALEELAIALVEAIPLPPPMLAEPPKPSDEAIAELQRAAEKYDLVLTPAKAKPLPAVTSHEEEWHRWRQSFDEHAWKVGERIAVVPQDFWGCFIICGDGKWDRPNPTIGVIDMTRYGVYVRAHFGANPNQVVAWFNPDEFHHMQRV